MDTVAHNVQLTSHSCLFAIVSRHADNLPTLTESDQSHRYSDGN